MNQTPNSIKSFTKVSLAVVCLILIILLVGIPSKLPTLKAKLYPTGNGELIMDLKKFTDPFCISSVDFSMEKNFDTIAKSFSIGPANFKKGKIDFKLSSIPVESDKKPIKSLYARLAIDCSRSLDAENGFSKIFSKTQTLQLSKLTESKKVSEDKFLSELVTKNLTSALRKQRAEFIPALLPQANSQPSPTITHQLEDQYFESDEDLVIRIGASGSKLRFDWLHTAANESSSKKLKAGKGIEIINDSQGSTLLIRHELFRTKDFDGSSLKVVVYNSRGKALSESASITVANESTTEVTPTAAPTVIANTPVSTAVATSTNVVQTPTKTPIATATSSATPTKTATKTTTSIVTPTRTPTGTITRTVTPTIQLSLTPTKTPTGTATRTVTPTVSNTPTRAPTQTALGNNPPVVNAGSDIVITLPANTANLSATATDSDGTIAARLWTKVSGPNAVLSGQSTNNLSISGLTAGTYVFRFMATDDDVTNSSDEVTVTVNPAVSTISETLEWDAVTTNTDGSAITNLAGYKVYLGTASGVYGDAQNAGLNTSLVINNLTVGNTYFAVVKSFNSDGVESANSIQLQFVATN